MASYGDSDDQRFIDAMREVLGLAPLYRSGRADRPSEMYFLPLATSGVGDGCRRVSAYKMSDHMKRQEKSRRAPDGSRYRP